jgi:ParB/RepB/Spo0J family partition protein
VSEYLHTDSIISNGNVRVGKKKKEKSYKLLKQNIKAMGKILVPLSVYKDNDQFVVLHGHQRLDIAKELEMNEVPVFVVEKPKNIALEQFSENLYSVDMSLYEEVMVYSKLAESSKTIKELCDQFGHSRNYIVPRIRLANLHPALLQPGILSEDIGHMSKIASYDITIQGKGLEDYCNRSGTSLKRITSDIKDGDFYWNSLKHTVEIQKPSKEDIEGILTANDLEKYRKNYDGELQQSLELFSNEKYLDWDFLDYCYRKKYPELTSFLETFAINPSKDNWSWDSKMKLSKLVSFKDPVRYINGKFECWNGDISNICFWNKKKKVVKTSKSEDTGDEKYSRQTTKFGKVIRKTVESHFTTSIDPLHKDENGYLTTFKWLVDNCSTMQVHPHYTHKGIGNSKPVDIMNRLTKEWYEDNYLTEPLIALDKLLKTQGQSSIKDVVMWEYEKSETFRKSILDSFTVATLKSVYETDSKKKMNIVEDMSKVVTKFPFKDLFTKENNWMALSLNAYK